MAKGLQLELYQPKWVGWTISPLFLGFAYLAIFMGFDRDDAALAYGVAVVKFWKIRTIVEVEG